MDEPEGFFRALFDTRFTTLVTPKIIRVLYILLMVVLGLGAIVFIIAGFVNSTALGFATLLVFAPIGFLLYLIVVRIYLEVVIVAFKINDSAARIAANTASAGGAPPPPPPAGTPGELGTPPTSG